MKVFENYLESHAGNREVAFSPAKVYHGNLRGWTKLILIGIILIFSQKGMSFDDAEYNKLLAFCKGYGVDSLSYIKRDGFYVVLPIKLFTVCAQSSMAREPIVVDEALTRVYFGYKCQEPVKTTWSQWQDRVPWPLPRFIEYEQLRDYDYKGFDKQQTGCYAMFTDFRKTDSCRTIEINKIRQRVDALRRTLGTKHISKAGPFTTFDLDAKLNFLDLSLGKGDAIVFDSIIFRFYVFVCHGSSLTNYKIKANDRVFCEFDLTTSEESITMFGLGKKGLKKDGLNALQVSLSLSDKRILSFANSDQLNKDPTYPRNSFVILSGKLPIAMTVGEPTKINGGPTLIERQFIFFKNSKPSSYYFKDTLKLSSLTLFKGGLINIIFDESSNPIYTFIKPNEVVTIGQLKFASQRWIGLDARNNVFYGFLESPGSVKGIEIGSVSSMIENHQEVRPFIVRNDVLESGYLANNQIVNQLPLKGNSHFEFKNNGHLYRGTFSQATKYGSHVYNPDEEINGSYKIDTVVTLLDKVELKAVLGAMANSLQDLTKSTLLEQAHKSPITGDYGENDVTQNITLKMFSNGFTFHNNIFVRNFLWQAILSDCDARLYYDLTLYWQNDYAKNEFHFYVSPIYLSNTWWELVSICPLGLGAFDLMLHIQYLVLAPFIQLTPEFNVYNFDKTVNNELSSLLKQLVAKNKTTITLQNLTIENEELKAAVRYEIEAL